MTKTVLLMSSFVSASRVGAAASGFCLRRMGIETAVLPTTLLGRHPGWGPPGGGPVAEAQLRDMWNAIAQQPLTFDAVMTGYMGEPAHVDLAASIIRDIKQKNPAAEVLVDPVMGDDGRLYISPQIASAIKETLLPLAGTITPNLWELSFLSGADYASLLQSPKHAAQAAAKLSAAHSLPCDVLVTSIPFARPDSVTDGLKDARQEIGAVLARRENTPLYISHEKFARVPHGGGDTLAAAYLARRLSGESREISLRKSMGSIFQIMSAAAGDKSGEIPLIAAQDALMNPAPLPLREI